MLKQGLPEPRAFSLNDYLDDMIVYLRYDYPLRKFNRFKQKKIDIIRVSEQAAAR